MYRALHSVDSIHILQPIRTSNEYKLVSGVRLGSLSGWLVLHVSVVGSVVLGGACL